MCITLPQSPTYGPLRISSFRYFQCPSDSINPIIIWKSKLLANRVCCPLDPITDPITYPPGDLLLGSIKLSVAIHQIIPYIFSPIWTKHGLLLVFRSCNNHLKRPANQHNLHTEHILTCKRSCIPPCTRLIGRMTAISSSNFVRSCLIAPDACHFLFCWSTFHIYIANLTVLYLLWGSFSSLLETFRPQQIQLIPWCEGRFNEVESILRFSFFV